MTLFSHSLTLRLLSAFLFALPQTATALTLLQCERVTHISHGGESGQRDLSEGRVIWVDWWSQEGTFTDVTLMDCASGEALSFRTSEFNMRRDRSDFDRRERALEVIDSHESGARAFATFDRIAADLERIARDITQSTATVESCACAALYPEMRGDKEAFDLAAEAVTPFSYNRDQ